MGLGIGGGGWGGGVERLTSLQTHTHKVKVGQLMGGGVYTSKNNGNMLQHKIKI